MTVHLSVWVWPAAFIVWVLGVGLGLWVGLGRASDRAYEAGYDACDADRAEAAAQLAEARGMAVVKRAAMIAWEQTHPAPLPPPLELEEWAVPLEYPPAGHRADVLNYEHFDCCGMGMVPKVEPAYAWEPWSLSAGTTLMEDVLAMCANADAAPSVRWLASLEPGQ
jgi:hypothetical protein